jgi:hypothetical protein
VSCMKDDHSVDMGVSQVDVDRLCESLTAIAVDWWRRQAHVQMSPRAVGDPDSTQPANECSYNDHVRLGSA